MQKKKLHIILSLVAIFVFPIVYQPLHIIHHQSSSNIEVKCEIDHHHATNKSDSEFHKKQDDCLVCTYEMTAQTFATLFHYTPPISRIVTELPVNTYNSASVSIALKHITRPPPTV